MARFEGGTVVFETTWTAVKDQIDTRKLDYRFEEDSTAYEIFAVDENFFYRTVIYKSGQAPQDQATYDAWRADFEANYKNRVVDFNNTSPVFISNIDGYSVVLKDGAAPTANDGYGIALIGYDGSNYRMTRMDSSGHQVLVGAGSAGTPAGGVISIQGVPGGESMPVSGTVSVSGSVTTTNDSVGSNNAAAPSFSTQIGGTDGTNLRASRIFDLDTGGGQEWVFGVGLRKASGGGSVELGTSSDPIRIDPTGTTIQPISGTVAATQSGTWTVQPGNTANTTPWLTTISQGGNSATVTASNALKIDGSAVTQPVSGTVTANAGTGNFTVVQSTASNLRAQTSSESNTGSAIPTQAAMVGGSDGANLRSIFLDSSGRQIIIGSASDNTANSTTKLPVIAALANTSAPAWADGNMVPLSVDTTGALRITGSISASNPSVSTVNTAPPGSATYIGGSVTTGAPTYTTGQMSPLSLDTTGALRITGSISASNPSVSTNNAAIPTSSTQIGGSDGTNLQAARVFDGDTGGGTQYILGVGLRKAASGGTVEAGTSADPIRIDPTGTTIQPVSGTVAATQSGTWTVQQGTPPWTVTGPGASGAAVSGNPVRVGGSDGTNTRNILTDTSGRQIMVGAAAVGASPAGSPLLLGSVAPTGNMINVVGGAEGSHSVAQGPNLTSVHSNSTITASGSSILTTSFYGSQQILLIINVKNSPTGTTPTIIYNISEIDPGDQTTTLSHGATASTVSISAIGTYKTSINVSTSSCIKISWTVSGSSPSFTGVYATVLSKSTSAPLVTNGVCYGFIALSTNGITKVESTTYTEQTTNATRSMSSSVVSDTAAGVGARTVLITYYDSSVNGPFTTTITLNGTTAVNTSVSNICFIESMQVLTAGVGLTNNGTISLFASTGGGGGTIGTITAFTSSTSWARHYVAVDKVCYITSFSASLTSTSGSKFFIRTQLLPTSTNSVEMQISEFIRTNGSTTGSSTVQVLYNNPIKVIGPARIRAYTQSDTSVSATHNAAFNYYDE